MPRKYTKAHYEITMNALASAARGAAQSQFAIVVVIDPDGAVEGFANASSNGFQEAMKMLTQGAIEGIAAAIKNYDK